MAVDANGALVDRFTIDADPNVVVCPEDPSPLSSLRLHVLTTPPGGRFRPRNVGAIWIETAAGAFVRTIEVWGSVRLRHLHRWQEASGGVVDALSSATLPAHQAHEPSWDLTDLDGCEIPSGDYRVVLEVTDRTGAGPSLDLPFHKEVAPITLEPDDAATFHELRIIVD